MVKYQKYAEYKDSGVEWLGEIPKSWQVKKLKYLCKVTTGSKDTVNAVEDGKYPFFVRSQTVERINSIGADCEAVLTAGDGVGVGKVYHYYKGKFDFHQRVYMLYDFGAVTGRFVYYYLSSNFYKVALEGNAKSTVDSLRLPQFLNFEFSLPTVKEQNHVVDFLDHETAQIDILITKQEKLIELLKEKRQAVISHAVTKGLNPNVPMKDSGVEWLGQVPQEWMVSRLGYETWIRARLGWKGLKADEYVDDGYIFLATPNIKGKQIDFKNVNYINKQRYEESPEIKLKIGDVLLTKDGSTLGTVNIVRDLPKPATVNSSIAVITPYKNLASEFLLYLLTSSFMVNTIQRIKGGMGVPHLFQGDLNKFYFPIPNPAEQFEIVKFLDQETAKIDTLISKAEFAIQLMQERRTALISAAVTGKIDVRNWQHPNQNNNNTELSA